MAKRTAGAGAGCESHAYRATLQDTVPMEYPNIVPCLVLPFERACPHESGRYPALVFARRGNHVLYADERRREYGVAKLANDAGLEHPRQYPTLDRAAREFLACK